jgi:hypothetical protein
VYGVYQFLDSTTQVTTPGEESLKPALSSINGVVDRTNAASNTLVYTVWYDPSYSATNSSYLTYWDSYLKGTTPVWKETGTASDWNICDMITASISILSSTNLSKITAANVQYIAKDQGFLQIYTKAIGKDSSTSFLDYSKSTECGGSPCTSYSRQTTNSGSLKGNNNGNYLFAQRASSNYYTSSSIDILSKLVSGVNNLNLTYCRAKNAQKITSGGLLRVTVTTQ